MPCLAGHQFGMPGDGIGEALTAQTQGRRLLPLPGSAGANFSTMQLVHYHVSGDEGAGATKPTQSTGVQYGMIYVAAGQRPTQATCRDTQLYFVEGEPLGKRKRAEAYGAPDQTPCSDSLSIQGPFVKRPRPVTDQLCTPVSAQYAPVGGCGECATPDAPRAYNTAGDNPFSWSPVPKQEPASLIKAAARKTHPLENTASFSLLRQGVPFQMQVFPQILEPITSLIPCLTADQQQDAIANEFCDDSDAVHTSSSLVISAPDNERVVSPAYSRATGKFCMEPDNDIVGVEPEPTVVYQNWVNDIFWSGYQTTPTSRYVPLTTAGNELQTDMYGAVLSVSNKEEGQPILHQVAPCNEPFLLPSLRLRTKRVC